MKTVLKRVMGFALALSLVVGVLYGIEAPIAKAESGFPNGVRNVGTIITNGTEKLTPNSSSTFHRLKKTTCKVNLDYNNQIEHYEEYLMVYLKVTFDNAAAATALKTCAVRLSLTETTQNMYQWLLSSIATADVTYSAETSYELYLPFANANTKPTEFSYTEEINFFQIHNDNETAHDAAAGITVQEAAIVTNAPIVQKYTSATAKTAPTENVPSGYVFAGWYTSPKCTQVYSGSNSEAYAKFVHQDVLSVKRQTMTETKSDADLVLADCDSRSGSGYTARAGGSMNYIGVTNVTGEYKQGTGALKAVGKYQQILNLQYTNTVDISAYRSGILHLKLFISGLSNNSGTTMTIDLATDTNSKDRIYWTVPMSDLTNNAWNEINLNLYDATTLLNGGTYTAFDYTKMNTIRVFFSTNSFTENVTSIVDDIRLLKSFDGVMINGCNTKNDMSFEYSTTLATTDQKEGTGCYQLRTGYTNRLRFYMLKRTIDISNYMEDGHLHMWVYLGSTLTNTKGSFVVRLGSGTTYDTNEYRYSYSLSRLTSGWNQIDIPLDTPYETHGTPDSKNIQHVWVYTEGNDDIKSMPMSIDDIRVVPPEHDAELVLPQKAGIRFVTTVDSLNYKEVGLAISINGGAAQEYSSTKVYTQLYEMGSNGVASSIDPTVFCEQSEYFHARVIKNIPSTAFGQTIQVTPYWVTQDGTRVTGVSTNTNTITQWIQ